MIWQSFQYRHERTTISTYRSFDILFMTLQEAWANALGELELEIPKAGFAAWFRQTKIESFDHGVMVLSVPSVFAKEWFEKRYHASIMSALKNTIPGITQITYVIQKPLDKETKTTPRAIPQETPIKDLFVNKDGLNPKYTFDTFIIGSFNELAHTAAVAITKSLGTAYNPLFIYGGVGLGKTHLLQAIGNKIKNVMPGKKVLYTTSEHFASEFISLIQQRKPLVLFKEKYRMVDVLIIDDIQFIANKTKCQEELFHTFNFLHERNKQIVFSSDRPPQIIPDLEDRLRSRFAAGLIADIAEPEIEARLAIIAQKLKEKEIALTPPMVEYIASSFPKNIRELEGIIHTIVAHTRIRPHSLSFEEIKELVDRLKIQTKKQVTTPEIITMVASFYDIDEKELIGQTRKKEVVLPRQVAMYLLRNDFNASLNYIGKKFGDRDHTTVLYACEKIKKWLKTDKQLEETIRKIRARFEY